MSSVFIGVGSNLASRQHGSPMMIAAAAVDKFSTKGIDVLQRSRWYRSAPEPKSAQPDYINAVVAVSTALSPQALLQTLHTIEGEFGRVRTTVNAARVLDLDLLAYGALVLRNCDGLRLPHPRMHTREFVLKPLFELAPSWRHPLTGESIIDLINALPADQSAEPIKEIPSAPIR